jgi:iron complex outermembrane receptor protein
MRVTAGLRWTNDDKTLGAANVNSASCQVPVVDRIGGACYARYRTKRDAWTYTLGADYAVTPDVMAYAKTSRGFRSGSVNQRGSAVAGSFAPYDPEFVRDYEVGIKSDWLDHRLRLNLAAYQSNYRDLQRGIPTVTPEGAALSLIQNAASARVRGAELLTTVVPVRDLELSLGAAYTDPNYKEYRDGLGRDLSTQHFDSTPMWTATLSGSYTLRMNAFDVRFNGNLAYRSSAHQFPDAPVQDRFNIQKEYTLANGRISFLKGDYELAVWGRNLFDKIYKAAVLDLRGTLGYATAYPGEPRTYGVELQAKF